MGKVNTNGTHKPSRPGLTPESEENRLIAKAMKLAERQIDEGTASSQVISHFLKLGTTKAELEREKLERENELLRAKTESLQSMQRMEELYASAIKAMQKYGGHGEYEDYENYDDEY